MTVIDRLFLPESLITLGAIFVLLLFSAFFSGSETALTASSRATMHKLEGDGVPFDALAELDDALRGPGCLEVG